YAKGLGIVCELPAIRGAIRDTPPAVQLALDYLTRRSDVDARRVEGVGVSLGAPFMIIAAALDTRITRLWIVHGSGGAYAPIEHTLRRGIPWTPARVPVAAMVSVIAGGPAWAPERWVGRVAPRPVVLIAARDDERLPRQAIESLWRRIHEPRRLVWLTGGHVSGRSSDQVAELTMLVLEMAGE
ncbi:MAG TPA: hypothetical protein VFY16_12145, partial [Gemmatimonadaceae bacterium]|nr:hypothetical protein [Gemmatimonadaceae bacterium]